MAGRLQTWLAAERLLSMPELEAAVARQEIYGGCLDTALLERGVMNEAAIWAGLAAATGLPAPEPDLCDPGKVMFPPAIAAEATRPLRAVPVAVHDGVVEILCAEPVAESAIRATAGAQGLYARLHIIPETRLWAMRQRAYGEPMPARFVPLLARAVGGAEARANYTPAENARDGRNLPPPPPPPRWASLARNDADLALAEGLPATPLAQVLELSGGLATTFPSEASDELTEIRGAQPLEVISETDGGPVSLEVLSAVPVAVPTNDEEPDTDWGIDPATDAATEALCRRARDPEDKGRLLALRALRRRLNHPATRTLVAELRQKMALPAKASSVVENESAIIDAIESVAELRDTGSLRALIGHLDGGAGSKKVAASARQALVTLTVQDCGVSPRRWQAWADQHAEGDRVEWLLDGLAHKRADIRLAALEELRLLAGKSFGYSVNGPKPEREAARRRFLSWRRNALDGGGDARAADPAFLQSDGAAPLPPGAKAR